jgi:hypothetical protein
VDNAKVTVTVPIPGVGAPASTKAIKDFGSSDVKFGDAPLVTVKDPPSAKKTP